MEAASRFYATDYYGENWSENGQWPTVNARYPSKNRLTRNLQILQIILLQDL